jgi:hypothetical protein
MDEVSALKTQRTPVIVVAPDGEWWEQRRSLYGMLLPTRKLGDDALIPGARIMEMQSADLQLAKSWIESCGEAHGDGCSGTQTAETGLWTRLSSFFAARPSDTLRVIDCRTKTVVAASEQCIYAALSYVPGTDRASTPKDLADWDRVPLLFQDAVAATVHLGYDYLWIDFYCISDDNFVLKEKQIRTMDRIYFEAQVRSPSVRTVTDTDSVRPHTDSHCLCMLRRRPHRNFWHKWESSSTVSRCYCWRQHIRSRSTERNPVRSEEQIVEQRLDISRTHAIPLSPVFHRAWHIRPMPGKLRRRYLRHRDSQRPAP